MGLNGLYFNIIREDTLVDCFNSSDARVRSYHYDPDSTDVLQVQVQASKEVLEAFEGEDRQ